MSGAVGKEMRCSTCKVIKPVSEYGVANHKNAVNGLNPRCKPCNRIKDRSPKSRFSQSKAKARIDGHEWHLSFEQWFGLVSQPCFYCAGPLPETGRGIDRQNNGVGYLTGNCVPCCALCNQAKMGTLTGDEMLIIGAAIKQIRLNREEKGLPPVQAWAAWNSGKRKINGRMQTKTDTTSE